MVQHCQSTWVVTVLHKSMATEGKHGYYASTSEQEVVDPLVNHGSSQP